MKGCRPLTDNEIASVLSALENPRDRALFVLGIRSGFRISELLSLRVLDVYQYGAVVARVQVQRKHMKRKLESRSVPMHIAARNALQALIQNNNLTARDHLFMSKKGHNQPMTRIQAWRILKGAYQIAELSGKVATHSMRKTFAAKVYEAVDGDLVKTQKALGHKSVNSTVSYLSFAEEEIDDAILSIA